MFTFDIIDIGTLTGKPGSLSEATAISSNGYVAGNSDAPNTTKQHGFFWDPATPGMLTDLGTIGGYDGDVYVHGVNAKGEVVGECETKNGNHAFLYTGGVIRDIHSGFAGASSTALAINDSSAVVGYAQPMAGGNPHPFLYSGNGPMVDLDPSGNTLQAVAIASNGMVGGFGSTARAYMNGAWTDLGTPTDLPPSQFSALSAISSMDKDGDAAGGAGYSAPVKNSGWPYIYYGGQWRRLPVLPNATGGWIAGSNYYANNVGYSLFGINPTPMFIEGIEPPKGASTLESLLAVNPGWTFSTANAISDADRVVGKGTIKGDGHAYVMVPRPWKRWPWLVVLWVKRLFPW